MGSQSCYFWWQSTKRGDAPWDRNQRKKYNDHKYIVRWRQLPRIVLKAWRGPQWPSFLWFKTQNNRALISNNHTRTEKRIGYKLTSEKKYIYIYISKAALVKSIKCFWKDLASTCRDDSNILTNLECLQDINIWKFQITSWRKLSENNLLYDKRNQWCAR